MHLFDIVEALRTRFDGGNRDIKNRQGLDTDHYTDLNKFGHLANDAPVRQGRHPGKKVGQLRDATEEERKVARQVARQLIFGYLQHIDKKEA